MDKRHPLNITQVRLKELEDFARSSLVDPAFSRVAPISAVRARAQAKNPLADPEDLALVVAFDRDRCIGYHGVLPGYLNTSAGRSKIYWLVTFYLDPDYRGRGCGKQLVQTIQETGVDLVATGLTQGAVGVYRSLGFSELGELPFGQLRLDRLQLANKATAGTSLHRLLRSLDKWYYLPAKKRFYGSACRGYRTPEHLRPESPDWQSPPQRDSRSGQPGLAPSFERGPATIGWMLQYPWIVSRGDAGEDVQHYYFSRVRDRFEFVILELTDQNNEPGEDFVILSLSSNKNRTVVKVLDYRVGSDADLDRLGYLVLDRARRVAADRIEYPASLDDFFRTRFESTSLLKRRKRLYLCYPGHAESPLVSVPDEVRLDYCDSDIPFT